MYKSLQGNGDNTGFQAQRENGYKLQQSLKKPHKFKINVKTVFSLEVLFNLPLVCENQFNGISKMHE